jgi:hypothetical protein
LFCYDNRPELLGTGILVNIFFSSIGGEQAAVNLLPSNRFVNIFDQVFSVEINLPGKYLD